MASGTVESRHRQMLQKIQDDTKRQDEYYLDVIPVLTQSGVSSAAQPDDMLSRFVSTSSNNNRGQLFEYMQTITDPSYLPVIRPNRDDQVCDSCRTICVQTDGMITCPKCGHSKYAFISAERPCFKEKQSHENVMCYNYKRINHFRECLACMQDKSSVAPPKEIVAAVHAELAKNRLFRLEELDVQDVHEVMKRMHLGKYYDRTNAIWSRITGQPIHMLTREQEKRLETRFQQLQEPFNRLFPDCSNFLNYQFTMRKLFELEGLPGAQRFSLPKSRKKTALYNVMWKALCLDLGWPYIPTVV